VKVYDRDKSLFNHCPLIDLEEEEEEEEEGE
jgi:hypothetical protein